MQLVLPTQLTCASMGSGVPDESIPEEMIPPKMRELIYAFQKNTSAPIPTIFTCVLATLAVVHGGKIDVESWKGGRFPLNFFALIASGTGEGKTSAINAVMRPVLNYDTTIREQQAINKNEFQAKYKRWSRELKAIEKDLDEAINSSIASVDDVEENYRKHLSEKPTESNSSNKIISDVSLSGLRDSLDKADGDSLLILNSDSARVFKETLLKYGPEFCSAWSAESFRIVKNRVNISVDNPRLSMLLMVQPSMIDGYFDDDHEFRTSGLAARFITYFPDSIVGQKWRINGATSEYHQSIIDNWYASINKQLNSSRLRHISCGNYEQELLTLSEESVRFLESAFMRIDKYLSIDNNDFSSIKDIAHRILEQSCRIAALYELFDDPDSREIKPHHMEMTFKLMLAHAHSFKRACNPERPKASIIKNANKILFFLRNAIKYHQRATHPSGYMVVIIPFETYQRVGPVRNKSEYDEAFRLLEMNNIIEIGSITFFSGVRNVNKKVIYLHNLQSPINLQP